MDCPTSRQLSLAPLSQEEDGKEERSFSLSDCSGEGNNIQV